MQQVKVGITVSERVHSAVNCVTENRTFPGIMSVVFYVYVVVDRRDIGRGKSVGNGPCRPASTDLCVIACGSAKRCHCRAL